MGRISTSPRYMIDIAEMDSLSLGELERVLIRKFTKIEVFLT